MMTNHLLVVDKKKWMDQLKVNIDIKMNLVINEEQTNLWFARTIKEIVKVQIFFDSFKEEFKTLRTLDRVVNKKESAILNFDWLDERTYDQWKTKHSMAFERVHMVAKDKEINWVEEEQPQVGDI